MKPTTDHQESSPALPGAAGPPGRSRWMMWSICLLALFTIAIAAAIPEFQKQRLIGRFEQAGASFSVTHSNHWGLLEWSNWLEQYAGFGLPLPAEVVGADLSQFPLDDETLAVMTGWPALEFVLMTRADISADGLRTFVNQTPMLSQLQVINCPQITPETIQQLRTAHPGLRIEYRGTAFLGIRGSDMPAGCMVFFVQPGSAAARDGLRFGDLITAFDGEPTTSFQKLIEQIAAHQPGDEVLLTIRREQSELEIPCTLGSWQDLR